MDKDNEKSVWILARPVSGANWFPMLAKSSAGKFHLCHWAVLVSNLLIEEIKDGFMRKRRSRFSNSKCNLGTLYELQRIGDQNTVNISLSFGIAQLDTDWLTVSAEYVGMTPMTNHEISVQGEQYVANQCSGFHSREPS